MVLNLDPTFKPLAGTEIIHESFVFSGGEPHIKIKAFVSDGTISLTHRINSFNDLGLLLIAVDALKRMGHNNLELILPYFPGARQDRLMIPGESLTVKIYADLINKLGLNQITLFDPHSEVAPALLDNCKVINNHNFIGLIVQSLPEHLILVSPDAGAAKKIHKLARHLKKYEVIECGKTRNVTTGALSGFKVPSKDLMGRPCLIVDDICDGGGTFMGLAEELKKSQAGDLYLAVSHGIFSKGLEKLSEQFENIFTTDSIRTHSNALGLTQTNLKDLL